MLRVCTCVLHMMSYTCCPTYAVLHVLSYTCCPTHAVLHVLSYTCCPTRDVLHMLSYTCCPTHARLNAKPQHMLINKLRKTDWLYRLANLLYTLGTVQLTKSTHLLLIPQQIIQNTATVRLYVRKMAN